MDTDDRFKHLASDPRFQNLRRRQRKVQIDERFQSMFTDEKFTLKYSKDKRGRKSKKTSSDDLKKFYSLEDKNSKEESDQSEPDEEPDDINDNESVSQSELSSSSDESDSELDGEDVEGPDVKSIQYDWQPLDHDADKTDTVTKRLAIQNLDWTHLDVKDVYTLISSVRTPLNVSVYVSEFGKKRLEKEEIEGPEELADMPQIDEEEQELNLLERRMQELKKNCKGSSRLKDYEDADEVLDSHNEELRERLRRYQLNRMRYYYAIAEFDSTESAEIVYKELDGVEYEGSSLELDLRFVPDDISFDKGDLQAECNKAPDCTTYKAPLFINTALQQTTVKFTWDETDVKRQQRLHKEYTKDELEKDDLEAYLASDTESDENDELESNCDKSDAISIMTGNSEARANKYRQLLKILDEEAEKKKKVDVDIEWADHGVNEAVDESITSDAHDSEDGDEEEHEDELEQEDEEKSSKRGAKKRRRASTVNEKDDDLDLLVLDIDASKQEKEFQFNPDDSRFKAVYDSGLYNIDPSHPSFKRTDAFNQIAEKKRQKRLKIAS